MMEEVKLRPRKLMPRTNRMRHFAGLSKGLTFKRGGPHTAHSTKFTYPCRRHRRHRFKPRAGKMPWRRKRQCTPELLPGESHGQRSLVA